MAYLFQQLLERFSDLRSCERFGNQQDPLGFSRTKACVSLLWSVTDDNDGEFGVFGVMTHCVEERLAHIEGGAIEDERIGSMLENEFVNRDGISG